MLRSAFALMCSVIFFSLSLYGADFSQISDEENNYAFELQKDHYFTAQINDSINFIYFNEGTQFVVLQTAIGTNGSEWVRVGIEYPENSDLNETPNDVWISMESFLNANVVLIEKIISESLSDSEEEINSELSSNNKKINLAGRDYFVKSILRMTYCYRYVKKYLLKVGLVKVYLPGASAYMAAKILPKHGFKRTSRSPHKAIKHDVCVYRGGPSGHGHIEIMTTRGWYYGYGYKKYPIKNRKLISCFYK